MLIFSFEVTVKQTSGKKLTYELGEVLWTTRGAIVDSDSPNSVNKHVDMQGVSSVRESHMSCIPEKENEWETGSQAVHQRNKKSFDLLRIADGIQGGELVHLRPILILGCSALARIWRLGLLGPLGPTSYICIRRPDRYQADGEKFVRFYIDKQL